MPKTSLLQVLGGVRGQTLVRFIEIEKKAGSSLLQKKLLARSVSRVTLRKPKENSFYYFQDIFL